MKVHAGPYESLPNKVREQLTTYSLLNSPGFLELWNNMGGECTYWMVTEGEQVLMVAGSVTFNRPLLNSVQFGPDGLYFTPFMAELSPTQISEAKEKLWSTVCKSYQRVYLADFGNLMNGLPSRKTLSCDTLIADIDSDDWLPPDKKLQSEIRKAEREQLQCEPFDIDKHYDKFIALMLHTESRHGRRAKYNESFYRALAEFASTESRLEWTVATQNNQMAASHINLIEREMLINWQVYYDKQFSSLKPNQYLLIDSIRRGHSSGVRRVNFGATPDEADGVRVYKEKWGGAPHRYQMLVWRRGLGWLR